MFGRLLRIAPALAIGILSCGCSMFASDPPTAEIATNEPGPSLKDEWEPIVVQATATRVLATPSAEPSPKSVPREAPSCKTDRECIVILRALINDPKRSWIREPQSSTEYANGTRFFAYRALRGRLSCRELELALVDMRAAADRLRMPAAEVSPAQAASALSLATVVSSELRSESASRCKA
jgi:hypothetical protein